MVTYKIKDDLKAFGLQVKTFPNGIGEAFDALVNKIPDGFNRSFYGIAFMDREGKPVYYAAAEETYDGEAEQFQCDRYTIEKGEYLAVIIRDWRKKTDSIKDVFHQMTKDKRVANNKPCIEWYKNDDEMVCLVKLSKS